MTKNKFLQGTIKRHPDGFGFFIPDNKDHPDVYIPRHSMQGVMTNDKVMVEITPEKGGERFRGEIMRVVARGTKQIVGSFHIINERQALIKDEGKGWGADLKIDLDQSMGAKEGQLVTAQILSYPDDGEPFLGKVVEIIGDVMDPMNDIKRVIGGHNIPVDFSSRTLTEAGKFPAEPQDADFKNRRDLRPLSLITIDGATAKDFDDAVCVEITNQGFLLYVAIADVSHYVRPGTSMDKDAYERGTSVYFPNYVVPMLPEALSNGLCSLNPHVNRLCLVAEIQFDFTGSPTRSEFYEAVMESKARVTYGEAQEVIDGLKNPKLEHVKENILRCADLAKILMAKRFKEGSLDLEIPETELEIDASGVPVDIIKSERLFSHRLIEELMLAANVAVGTFLNKQNIPALYRIHEPPNEQAIKLLEKYLWNFGGKTKLGAGKLQKRLTKALEEFEGKPEAQILHILTLRSMSQAKYSKDNVGHFGLGFEYYTHFTSPIRRYPDLIVHRLLKNQIMPQSGYRLMSEDDLSSAGTMLSACEQRSVKAERQVQGIKKARFMQKFVGQELDGMVSSVAKFGVFVLLREYACDGLIRLDDLTDDRYEFDEENLKLIGRHTKKMISIGDEIKIQVASADPEMGQVNFLPVGLEPRHPKEGKRPLKEEKRHSERPSKEKFVEKAKEDPTIPPKYGREFFFKGRNVAKDRSEAPRSKKLQFADRAKLRSNFSQEDEKEVDNREEHGFTKNRKSNRQDSKKRGQATNDRGGVRKARVSRGRRKNKAR